MKASLKKYLAPAIALSLASFTVSTYADDTSSNKQVVESMFQVFANTKSSLNDFSKYISPAYTQTADGHTLNYQGFLTHVQGLHNAMTSIYFTFDQIVSEGDVVATHHIANGVEKNGQHVETEFFAFFTLKNHKIILCQEVSRLIQGSAADRNLSYK